MAVELEPIMDLIAIRSIRDPKALHEPEYMIACHDVLDFFEPHLEDYTFDRIEVDGIPSALVYKGVERPQRIKKLLHGHLDVVRPQANPAQFMPKVLDGRLFGRGAADMKAGAWIMAMVFKEAAGKLPPGELALMLVTDEEIGGYKGAQHWFKNLGLRADIMVTGEPSGLTIGNESKGAAVVKATAYGNPSHAAAPWRGENAILENGRRFINWLSKNYKVPREESWVTTITPTIVETTNMSTNTLPGNMAVTMDIRYTPEEQETYLSKLEQYAKAKGLNLERVRQDISHYTSENNPLVQELRQAVMDVQGHSEFSRVPFITDGRHLHEVGGAAVSLGVRGLGTYEPDESAEIASFDLMEQVLKRFVSK